MPRIDRRIEKLNFNWIKNFLPLQWRNFNFSKGGLPIFNLRAEGARENFFTIIVAYNEEGIMPIGAAGENLLKINDFL